MNLTDIQGTKNDRNIRFKNSFESCAKKKRSQMNSKPRADRRAEHQFVKNLKPHAKKEKNSFKSRAKEKRSQKNFKSRATEGQSICL